MLRGRLSGLLVLATIGIAALAGCGSDGSDGSEGGIGVPTSDLLQLDGADRELPGTVAVEDNGCFHIDTPEGRMFVVWPPGFEQDADVVNSPEGLAFGDGSSVTGMARVVDVAAAVDAADGPDGYLDSITGFCVEDGEQVAVYSVLG